MNKYRKALDYLYENCRIPDSDEDYDGNLVEYYWPSGEEEYEIVKEALNKYNDLLGYVDALEIAFNNAIKLLSIKMDCSKCRYFSDCDKYNRDCRENLKEWCFPNYEKGANSLLR